MSDLSAEKVVAELRAKAELFERCYERTMRVHELLTAIDAAADLIAQQAARLEEVTSALKPFAREADEWGDRVSDGAHVVIAGPACDEPADALFTVGDLRRARAALSEKETGG